MTNKKHFNGARRALLTALAGLYAAPAVGLPKGGQRTRDANTLWYRQPAAHWEEALPLGNGRLGAMVFGRVAQERLQLNDDTLWSGAPYTPDNPAALAALPQVRQLIADGKFKEADALAGASMMGKPLWQMAYGRLGDLLLAFDGVQEPIEYERRLELDTAVNTTSYRTPAGSFLRESFISSPYQVIVLRRKADHGRIGFELAYRGPRQASSTLPEYRGEDTGLVPPHAADWLLTESASAQGCVALLIRRRNF